MKIFLVIVCTILVASGAPHNQSPLGQSSHGQSYSNVQAVTTQQQQQQQQQLSSSTPSSQPLRASASIQQPLYSVPASLLQQNAPPQQEYNSVVPDNSYSPSHINPVLQSYGSPQQQQQQQQQVQQQNSGHQQINSGQPLSYNQYQTLLENGNPQLHSTPFHVSNDYSESTVPDSSHNNAGDPNNNQKQTVVIHKHIHMHYFVRGAELPDLPPVPEEKTFVYVLLKKPDGPPSIVFPTQVPTKPTKPEVYFIQYKDPKNKSAENKQASVQSGSLSSNNSPSNLDSSNSPVPSSQYGARIAKSAPS